ncbi:MAG: STAS domain-containing protein [Nocardioidaceae bacterium]|nr:MAG: STAS domain-containing protein [Nocardioidaceae bacterium]
MQIRRRDATLVLAGHFDGRCTAQVREELRAAINETSDTDIVLDLAGVLSVDATAIKLIAAASATLEERGRRLILRGCSPGLKRVLTFTRWRRLFQVERDIAQPA